RTAGAHPPRPVERPLAGRRDSTAAALEAARAGQAADTGGAPRAARTRRSGAGRAHAGVGQGPQRIGRDLSHAGLDRGTLGRARVARRFRHRTGTRGGPVAPDARGRGSIEAVTESPRVRIFKGTLMTNTQLGILCAAMLAGAVTLVMAQQAATPQPAVP